jgi:hypothetical protein
MPSNRSTLSRPRSLSSKGTFDFWSSRLLKCKPCHVTRASTRELAKCKFYFSLSVSHLHIRNSKILDISKLSMPYTCSFATACRFVFSPIAETDKRLNAETAGLKSEIENLGKKLHYLETTYRNSKAHMDQIFQSGGRS